MLQLEKEYQAGTDLALSVFNYVHFPCIVQTKKNVAFFFWSVKKKKNKKQCCLAKPK